MFDHGVLHALQTAVGQRESALWMLLYGYLERELGVARDVLINLRR